MVLIPRKRFGQNFLRDPKTVNRIIEIISPQPNDRLVEIGPGLGALTLPLLQVAGAIDVVELDRDLIPHLRQQCEHFGELRIHCADALRFDFGTLATVHRKLRVLGNLPYNISTPLIFHLLKFAPKIQDMHLMFQKEVTERLCARPGTKAYGRLSVVVQYYCTVEQRLAVNPRAFWPKPRVESAFVRLTPRDKPIVDVGDTALFESIVQKAFSHRRKTLQNALKGLLDKRSICQCDLDPTKRPGTLDLKQFAALSKALHTLAIENKPRRNDLQNAATPQQAGDSTDP